MMNAALPPPAVINSERRDMSLLYPLADDSFRRTSAINGIGWVGGAASVQSVDLLLDGVPVGRAILGLASSDLAGLANDAPDAAGVGFVFSIPAALAQCDTPTLEVRATTTAGTEALHVRLTIIAGDEATFLPSWHVPRPAPRYLVAYPDRPLRDARRTDLAEDQQSLEWVWRLEPIESAGPKDLAAAYRATDAVRLMCEEAVLFEDGQLAVKGWAVATAGIADLLVLFDGEPLGSASPDEPRADVGNAFPAIAGAHRAGFRFARRLSDRVSGEHVITLLARDHDGQEARVVHHLRACPVPGAEGADVRAPLVPEARGGGIRAFLDLPRVRDGRAIGTSRGSLTISGWAFSSAVITAVEVFIDDHPLGRAYYGVRRADVLSAYPDCSAPRPGFAMVIPSEALRPGKRAVRVVVSDQAGARDIFAFTAEIVPGTVGVGPWALRSHVPWAEIRLASDIIARSGPSLAWHVLVPIDPSRGVPETAIGATLTSLSQQAWPNWTATILVADARQKQALKRILTRVGAGNRLRLAIAAGAGLLANLAPDAAIVTVLAPGDRLGEDALLELSLAAATQPAADFLYSDALLYDPTDGRKKPFFKPDFSPDLLLANNYIGRLWAARRGLLTAAAITTADLFDRGEWDAVLRLTEKAADIAHVAKVLCDVPRPRDNPRRDRQALARALERRGIVADIMPGPVRGAFQLRRAIPAAGRVSIIIPTAGARGMIGTLLQLIRTVTDWPDYEIICLDNIPDEDAPGPARLKALLRATADIVLSIDGPFNWSRFNNHAARVATGNYLLFLNDDIEMRDPGWLRGLVEQAQRPDIGVVGPQLLYPDGRVQHAGMFLTERSARHAFRLLAGDAPGGFGLARTQREVVSVTGACMMTRRDVFDRIGGFNEAHPVINNDLDYNLRAHRLGLRVLYTPAVSLIHHEMVSRAALADDYDVKGFSRAWEGLFAAGDPFHNPNLSREVDDYVPISEPVLIAAGGSQLATRAEIRRILVVKLDHLGDFITAFPALRRLRAHFPNAELVVLAATASLAWGKLEPAIDRMIAFDFFHARSSQGRRALGRDRMAKLAAQLAAEGFDLAVDLRRQSETRPVLRHTGARWLAGFDRGHAHPWLHVAMEFEGDVERQHKRNHASDAMVRLVDAVAVQFQDDHPLPRPTVPRAAGRLALRALLAGQHRKLLAPGKRLVCVHPGAGSPNKQWPLASFATLIEVLVTDGLGVIVIGGADEAALVARLLRGVRDAGSIVNLAGKVGLAELPNILAAMDLFVGNDSGPKHLAATLGVPTVGIHSGTVDAGEWAPVGPMALAVRRDTVCSPCYLSDVRDCHRGLACLTGIAVSDVYRACRKLLAASAGGKR